MSGYIGSQPVPQATQTRQTFTATSGQTSFATIGYVAGGQFIQVYLNGVLLKLTDDYTAANGSDIVLTSGAATGDILEFITFADFTVNNQNFTGTTTAADLSVTGAFTSQGIDDNATSTAMTLDGSGNLLVGKTNSSNAIDGTTVFSSGFLASTVSQGTANSGSVAQFRRNTTYGDIVTFVDSDATTVGSIGSINNDLTIGNGDVRLRFNDSSDEITPRTSDNTGRDAAIDLGTGTIRFKDLYLSGGVYLGGTGSANLLDDYEEGTWTPAYSSASGLSNITGFTNVEGKYVKVGDIVHAVAAFDFTHTGIETIAEGDYIVVSGLPFAGEKIGVQGINGLIGTIHVYGSFANNVNATGFAQLASTSDEFYFFVQKVNGALDTADHCFVNFKYST
jgi:hypothetical protein